MALSQEELKRVHLRLKEDLEFYARNCLFIKDKKGNFVPFIFNKAQRHLHEQLEKQLEATGKVRAYILKGRQQGISTYIAARYYHKGVWKGGRSIYILSHETKSTEALFGKVDTFLEKAPPSIKPKVKVNNKNELVFENDSQYAVGTARAKDTGRGQTNQLFHGSEVAFYENTDGIQTGVLQTVSSDEGTEILLESTANGIGNSFHQGCMDALEGKGEYILVFIPWYWQDEYTAEPPAGWEFTQEELILKANYKLTDGQLYWRYLKIKELKSESKFKQEYPFTVAEAFQASGSRLINAEALATAKALDLKDPEAPIIMGVDPARTGDRTVIAIRQGRHLREIIKYDEMDSMRLAGICSTLIDRYGVDKCFIDTGLGYGTIDRLHENGYREVVQGVHFGSKPLENIYLNKRAEMAISFRDWLHEGGVSVPNDPDFDTDIMAIPDVKENSRGMQLIEAKDKIKESYGKSTDIFDAVILTFAAPVRRNRPQERFKKRSYNNEERGCLSTMKSRRQSQRSGQARDKAYNGPSW